MEAAEATTVEAAVTVASINEDNEEGSSLVVSRGPAEELDAVAIAAQVEAGMAGSHSQIGGGGTVVVDQQDEEGRIMVNLEAIEVVSNLDEVSLNF